MNVETERIKPKVINQVAVARREAMQFMRYMKTYFFQKQAEFVCPFLQFFIAELRAVHDEYQKATKGMKKNGRKV